MLLDLARLVAAGLLEGHGAGRARRYAGSRDLHARIAGLLGMTLHSGGDDGRRQIITELADRIHAEDVDRGRLAVQPQPDLP